MFNEEVKNAFLRTICKESVRDHISLIFRNSSEFEQEFGKDLSEFNNDEIQRLFNKYGGARHSAKITFTGHLSRYLDWASQNGFNVICDLSKIDIIGDSVAKFRAKMVFSPEHLNRYMDAVFGSVDNETVGVAYRCYLWLAFCNVDLDDAMELRTSDVDIDLMRVMVSGREIPLYKESIRAFELAKTLKRFRVIKSNTTAEIYADREDGTRLLRASKRAGVSKKDYDSRLMTGEVARNIRFAYKKGIIQTRIGYSTVRLSGIFYRALLREQMGMEPNFQAIVDMEMADYQAATNLNYNSRKCRLLGNYKRDYEIWKMAYAMFEEDSHL